MTAPTATLFLSILAAVRSFSAEAAPRSSDLNLVIEDTCVVCHNDTTLIGNLSLESFDVSQADKKAPITEKVIRKLRAGMMPPPEVPRPDEATLKALVETLEATVDAAALRDPNPGIRPFQRLNRPEYQRAVKDLLALDVDAADWLPLDQMSANFDNIADEQTLSPTLLEAYLNAAADISRLAVGDRNAPTVDETYTNPIYVSQHPWDHDRGRALRDTRRHGRGPRVPGGRGVRLRDVLRRRRQLQARGHRRLHRRRARGSPPLHQDRRAARTAGAGRRSRPSRSSFAPASTACPPRSSGKATVRTKT